MTAQDVSPLDVSKSDRERSLFCLLKIEQLIHWRMQTSTVALNNVKVAPERFRKAKHILLSENRSLAQALLLQNLRLSLQL
jgi:hypothetical protein